MKITNFNNFTYCETVGLGNCFTALGKLLGNYLIDAEHVGFNANSGYVYIALDNGISICSLLGGDVEYLATCFETGAEFFFDNYGDCLDKQRALNKAYNQAS